MSLACQRWHISGCHFQWNQVTAGVSLSPDSLLFLKVMDFWNHTDFQLSAHPTRDVAIITGADDIITSVEESQVTLSNIRGSRFVTPIKVLIWWRMFYDMVTQRRLFVLKINSLFFLISWCFSQSIKNNCRSIFKALVEDWSRKLKLFARTLDEWLLCQRNWLYLESIFSAADIQRW